ncbi:MAG: heme-binding protein [Phycisphaerales bacterium]|nr:heme-binding protein [Phycisphaerales bacterium]
MDRRLTIACLSIAAGLGAAWIGVSARAAGPLTSGAAPDQPHGVVSAHASLTLEGARLAGDTAAAYAREHGAGGAIAVVDEGGALLYLVRLDNTFPAASEVSIAKARTAAVFRRPTQAFENAIRDGRVSLTAVGPMTPLEGGVPIVVDGHVVGAIGCSGAMSSAQDVEVAQAGAASIGN